MEPAACKKHGALCSVFPAERKFKILAAVPPGSQKFLQTLLSAAGIRHQIGESHFFQFLGRIPGEQGKRPVGVHQISFVVGDEDAGRIVVEDHFPPIQVEVQFAPHPEIQNIEGGECQREEPEQNNEESAQYIRLKRQVFGQTENDAPTGFLQEAAGTFRIHDAVDVASVQVPVRFLEPAGSGAPAGASVRLVVVVCHEDCIIRRDQCRVDIGKFPEDERKIFPRGQDAERGSICVVNPQGEEDRWCAGDGTDRD